MFYLLIILLLLNNNIKLILIQFIIKYLEVLNSVFILKD